MSSQTLALMARTGCSRYTLEELGSPSPFRGTEGVNGLMPQNRPLGWMNPGCRATRSHAVPDAGSPLNPLKGTYLTLMARASARATSGKSTNGIPTAVGTGCSRYNLEEPNSPAGSRGG